MRKRIFFVFLSLFILSLCAIPASAADMTTLSYAEDGFNGAEKSLFNPSSNQSSADDEQDILTLGFPSGRWMFTGDIENQRRTGVNGVQSAIAYIRPEGGLLPEGDSLENYAGLDVAEFLGYTELSLNCSSWNVTLDGFSTLCIGLSVDGVSEHYPVRTELITEDGTVTAETYLTVREEDKNWNILYVDLSDIDGKLIGLSVRVTYGRDELPTVVSCSAPYLAAKYNVGFGNAERFSSSRISAITGSISYTSGIVTPSSDKSAHLRAKLTVPTQPKEGSSTFFEIKLSGISQGNMTLGILPAGMDESERMYSRKVSLVSDDGIYIIPFDVPGDIYSYSLQFDNLEYERNFTIEYIKICSAGVTPLPDDPNIGSVSSIRLSENSVTFSGSMRRDSSTRFDYKSIQFYAIPGTTSDDPDTAINIGSTKVSNLFETTVDLSAYPTLGDTFMFYAAIEDLSGNIYPFSSPRYADAGNLPETSLSNVGLYNAATVGAFESNVSHVMMDVPLDQLILRLGTSVAGTAYTTYSAHTDEDGSTAVSSAGQLYFDHDLLDELDRDIEFYVSAGIEVYLRITSSSFSVFADGLFTDDLSAGVFSDDTAVRYAAVIRFLAQRYSGTAGFVIGDGVNSSVNPMLAAFSDLADYSAALAELCRITYNAAVTAIPDIFIIVPFIPGSTASVSISTTEASSSGLISERTVAVMLAGRLSDIGSIPWAFMYTFRDNEDDLSAVTSLDRLFSDLELNGADAAMFFYQPNEKDLLADYRSFAESLRQSSGEGVDIPNYRVFLASAFGDICDMCADYRARAVFLSLDGISVSSDHDFYAGLKNAGKSDRYVYDSQAGTTDINAQRTGRYTLWDFSDQYYPLDWIAGGGVSSCTTESSTLFATEDEPYKRVLRSSFKTEGSTGIAGITMRNFRRKYDFTAIDDLSFTFAIEKADDAGITQAEAEAEEGVTVVFVIGTDDYRAEYYADSVPCGEIQTLTCDLTQYKYRDAVDYVGIMVYADYEVYLDLSAVEVSSTTLDDDALTEMFTAEQESGRSSDWIALCVFILIIVIITISMVTFLTKRDHDEDELREAERRSNPQNRRHSRTSGDHSRRQQ